MIYILNAPPNYCPQCGKDLSKAWRDKLNRQDFYAHAAHTCTECSAHYQYVSEELILKIAEESGGDLKED